ncbi:MAG: DUF2889 domain-containing protein [Sphingomonadaceae bacterium]|nr:DUF2889 domain-containing protein [Sphingomonadaceae bacterium]
MAENDSHYPQFPSGLWRRVVLHPGPGWIGGALEDDMHQFHIRFDHADGRITSAKARALRHPWTGCGGAPDHIAADLTGELLSDVANRDPKQHCTHLFDLAIVCAAHANDTGPSCVDMRVADRVDDRTTATLHLNGEEKLHWQLDGTIISGSGSDGPEHFIGRDTKALSKWKSEYPPKEAEWATMLRRTCYISPARTIEIPKTLSAIQSPHARHRICFNYREPQIDSSMPIFDRRDFSMSGREPLQDFDTARDFASLT